MAVQTWFGPGARRGSTEHLELYHILPSAPYTLYQTGGDFEILRFWDASPFGVMKWEPRT